MMGWGKDEDTIVYHFGIPAVADELCDKLKSIGQPAH
jgi:hypothetical protein